MNKKKLTEYEVEERIVEQGEAIDLIAKELTFLLSEAQKHQPQVGSPLGDELAKRFLALYEDFKKIRTQTEMLYNEVCAIQFTDKTMGIIYQATASLLVRKMGEGLFEQFISVAEHGCLPDGTTFEDLDESA